MVYEAANAVSVPVIGMGGIATGRDAIEMILAGSQRGIRGDGKFPQPGSDNGDRERD